MMSVDNKLRFFRENAGVSIADLSRACDISDKTIRKIETRKLNKSRKTTKVKIINGLNKIAEKDFKYEEIFPNG